MRGTEQTVIKRWWCQQPLLTIIGGTEKRKLQARGSWLLTQSKLWETEASLAILNKQKIFPGARGRPSWEPNSRLLEKWIFSIRVCTWYRLRGTERLKQGKWVFLGGCMWEPWNSKRKWAHRGEQRVYKGNMVWKQNLGICSIQVMGWPRPLGQDCQRGGRKSRREAKGKHVGRWVVKRLNRAQVWWGPQSVLGTKWHGGGYSREVDATPGRWMLAGSD